MTVNQIIPVGLRTSPYDEALNQLGFERIHQGKVRDTYTIPGVEDSLLFLATDRISAFDFVLNALIPQKGEVLTALTHFWLTGPLKDYPSHLVTDFSPELEEILSKIPAEIRKRSLVVMDMRGDMDNFELIFRGYIGGSVYKGYKETGMAGGHEIKPGLSQWSRLEEPIFTPSTKAETGHDVNISANDYFYQKEIDGTKSESTDFIAMLSEAYAIACDYAMERGIVLLDTKFEGNDVQGWLADEVLTPDSSRYSGHANWQKTVKEGAPLISLDKQFVREIVNKIPVPGGKIGIKSLDPESIEDRDFVHKIELPNEVISKTTEIYKDLFEKLTGISLETYQTENLI